MLIVLTDVAAVALAVARRLAVAAQDALDLRGVFRLAVPGGGTPVPVFRLLVSAPWRGEIDWSRVELFFTDERAVPPDSPDSNAGMVRRELAEPLGIADLRVHRMRGDASDLEEAARVYDRELDPPLDAVLLGVGPDAHIASLFPGSPLLDETSRRVAPVLDSPKPPPRRLTLTPAALAESRDVLVMCTGAEKAASVAGVHREHKPPRQCPAALVSNREWYVDRDAAGWLASSSHPSARTAGS